MHVVEGRLYVPYHNWYGKTATKFFIELRDNGRFLATRCKNCDITYMPPRSVCGRCLSDLTEWVELPPTGTLLTYTVVNYDYTHPFHSYQPLKPPYIVGIIKLDGASTGLCHFVGEVDPEDIKIGMRLRAVLKEKEERKGEILDIKYFRPE